MLHKQVDAAITHTDRGEFSAIAAAYTVDRQNEVIRRGAFADTIGRWKASDRRLPLQWNHEASADSIIGYVDPASMRETDRGLYVEGRLDLEDSAVAREAWRSMRNNTVALSFGYLVTDQHERSDGIRELRGVDVFEVTLTPSPANPDTRVLSMKSVPLAPSIRVFPVE